MHCTPYWKETTCGVCCQELQLSNDIRYHIKELILDIFPNIDMLYGACSSDSDTV